MGKSRQQKQAEAMDLQRQRDQMSANKWMSEFSQELSRMAKGRFEKEQAYLTENVDPLLKGYATTGFAPGERRRLRNVAEEDISRVYGQQERRTLKDIAMMGITSNAPSGALARVKTSLGRSRAGARVGAIRGIEQYGATTRRSMVPLMMQRAAGFNPQGPLSGVFSGRPANISQAQFGPGFWSKFGGVAKDFIKSGISAYNPIGKIFPGQSTGGVTT